MNDAFGEKLITFDEARESINSNNDPHVLVFGTAWGLAESVMEAADHIMSPVKGNGEYNHLSVRTAVAIIVDRLLGNFK